MQMSEMEKATENYITAIQKTEQFRNYCDIKAKVKQDEELWGQLCEYRKKRYEFQNLTSPEELFDRVEAFEREYGNWKKNPEVSAFLDAELAFCRMIQESNLRIMDVIQFE